MMVIKNSKKIIKSKINMKYYILLLILGYCTVTINAQNNIDKNVIPYLKKADTLLWSNSDYEKIEILSNEVLKLCKNKDCGEYFLEAKLNIAIIKEQRNDYEDFDNFVLPTVKNHHFKSPLLKAKFLYFLGNALGDDIGINYLLEAQEIYEKHDKNNLFLGKIYSNLHILYINKANYDSSRVYIDLLEVFAERTDNIQFQIEALKGKAIIFNSRKEYAKAFLCILKADKIYAKYLPNDPKHLELQLYDLVTVLFQLKRYDEALKIIKKVEKHHLKEHSESENGTDRNLFVTYIMKNNVLRAQKNYQAALVAVENAQKYFSPTPPEKDAPYRARQEYLADSYLIKASKIRNLINLDRFEEAETLTYEIIEIAHDSLMENFHKFMIISVVNKFFDESKYPPKPAVFKLIPYIDAMLAQNEKQYNQATLNAYQLLAYIQLYQNKTELAAQSYSKVFEIKDTLASRENEERSNELLVQYETKEKEQQLALQKTELSKKTLQRNSLIIVSLMFLGFGWYFRKQNNVLRTNKQIIENQAKELHQVYESKNRFFVNIAHELRTPLTLIAGPIFSILKSNDLPQNVRQSLNIVNRNVSYLKQLTNQILDLSKTETKEFNIQISTFQFSDMLSALVQDFQSFADYKKIEFTTPNNIHNPIQLSTDGEKLFIILKNLLSNAFKYTNTGGKVYFDYVDMNDKIQVTIQDTGRGISEENLKNVFNRYFQTNDPNAPIEGGTGIGLAVCKEYIKSINGTIQVNSEVGKGSTFVIQFPKMINGVIAENSNLSFLRQVSIDTVISNTGISIVSEDIPTILVVEDNLDICQYLRSILQNEAQIIFANNGEEALHQLYQHPKIDLILTDLMMPIMDGFELIENLKKQDTFRNIPIITLTARSEMADKLTALRIGVDDYLIKPFNEDELKVRIKNLLGNQLKRERFLEEITEEEGYASADTEPQMKASFKVSKEDNEWLIEVERVIKKQITNIDFNVNQLCLDMAISPSQLYRKLKGLTGLSPKNYINQIRYHQAKQLLENQAHSSVKRIAYEVGFKDEKNFSRNFKKRFGKYPSDYLE